jgi:uncharacterized protein involved in exopolysaccharide biosynthesis
VEAELERLWHHRRAPLAELTTLAALEERLAGLERNVATLQQQLEAVGQTEGKLEELVALLQQQADWPSGSNTRTSKGVWRGL